MEHLHRRDVDVAVGDHVRRQLSAAYSKRVAHSNSTPATVQCSFTEDLMPARKELRTSVPRAGNSGVTYLAGDVGSPFPAGAAVFP
jgi:hypothetical protein